jgi:hypothetical protein
MVIELLKVFLLSFVDACLWNPDRNYNHSAYHSTWRTWRMGGDSGKLEM